MFIDDDGTKYYLFGGITTIEGRDAFTAGDLYELNLDNLQWTKKTTAPPAAQIPRSYMACAVTGQTFVAWGGKYTPSSSSFSETLG